MTWITIDNAQRAETPKAVSQSYGSRVLLIVLW